MAAVLPRPSLPAPWALALGGLAALYLPIWWWAFGDIWQTDEHGHGPIILAIVLWLFWRQRHAVQAAAGEPARWAGALSFALGLAMYLTGRAFDISIFEFGSQLPVVLGVVLLLAGWSGARAAWFPLLYLVFMVPLPGMFVDAATGALKQWVSAIAENLLYAAGYPIGRSGVMLTVGQYQLLVADACSGLNSMFSLSALGLVFMYLMRRPSVVHNAVMVLAILPIAFASNIVRVMVLVLVTYHFGDEAGQGFLHGAAGIVLMLVALAIFFVLDAVLAGIGRLLRRRRAAVEG